ncbi:hypothetical protein AMK17_37900 [Streptomyces sp. CB00072]|uniref:hypothetical protein n=1 Tax=Streptomyces sp. CB00072 TaxID=1703928 RepID=UPI00094039BF|nr:hypothetical protein [Streptomyces sp. CB00072]OKI49434.1 hypothetical protein AMK17_37900 [Streptomyces sp. CB00072]
MLSLFARRTTAPDPALWSPSGTTVGQRYRNTLGPSEGAIVLVYTSASDRSSAHAAACLGCTYRAARNTHRVRLTEKEAADLANTHAAQCRAINQGVPAAPHDTDAAQIVRSRLQDLRPHGVSPYQVHLADFLTDRIGLQRDDDFIKQVMVEIARTENGLLKAATAYSGNGTMFLVQPHPPRK